MSANDEEKVILNIGTWSSTCMACSKGAAIGEKSHKSRLGYPLGGDRSGCGKKFTHVTTDYVGMFDVRKLRPDLEYIDPMEAHEYVQ